MGAEKSQEPIQGEGSPPALELNNLTRRFGPVTACLEVSLSARRGEIHALVGENGAGKSTLMQLAAGLLRPDSGSILVRGQRFGGLSPRQAIELGIGLVQQHFALIPRFTVMENVVLGSEPQRGLTVDRARANEEVLKLARGLGFDLDPTAQVADLPVGAQQKVEILKVLWRKASIILLDEPTAVLAPVESEELFKALRTLRAEGATILFVTHRLKEVLSLADTVTVMRRGRRVGFMTAQSTSVESLAALMVEGSGNRTLVAELEASEREPSKARGRSLGGPPSVEHPRLRVERLRVRDRAGIRRVEGVSLTVSAGEILGIAGVQGNGQSELIEALAGLLPYEGRISVSGKPIDALDAGGRFQAGLAHIPEDRLERGLVREFSIAENLLLGRLKQVFGSSGGLGRLGLTLLEKARAEARQATSRFDIRPGDPDLPISGLSGGNQQKVVVARELFRSPQVLLAAQPTRGVDVGAMAIIHKSLLEARAGGAAILLVSADLSELMALSDRIVVMFHGKVAGELRPCEWDEATLGTLMTGGTVPKQQGTMPPPAALESKGEPREVPAVEGGA